MKLNARTNLGCTAFVLPFQNGRKYVVKLLVKNQARFARHIPRLF